MPTICKITLDSSEYKAALTELVEHTKQESANLSKTMASVAAPVPEKTIEKSGEKIEQTVKKVEKSAKASVATIKKEAAEAEQALDQLHRKQDRKTPKTNPDIGPTDVMLEKLLNRNRQVPSGNAGSAMGLNQGAEAISKAGGAIAALSQSAGMAAPKIGIMGQVLSALVSPVGLITTGLGALAALGMSVWDSLTVSAEEHAQKMEKIADENQEIREKLEARLAVEKEVLSVLRQANGEMDNAAGSTEAASAALSILIQKYGDLGAVVDAATGKITNYAQVEQSVREKQNEALVSQAIKERTDYDAQARAYYISTAGTVDSAGSVAQMEYAAHQSQDPENEVKYYTSMRNKSTSKEEFDRYDNMVTIKKKAAKAWKESQNLQEYGYRNEEERDKAIIQKKQEKGQITAETERLRDQRQNAQNTDRINAEDDPEKKYAMLQKMKYVREWGVRDIDKKINALPTEKAGMQETEKLEIQKERARLERDREDMLTKQYAVEQQMAAIERNNNKIKKQMLSDSAYEVEYQMLLTAGKLKEAEILKQNYELGKQKVKLTEEEKRTLRENQQKLRDNEADRSIAEMKDELAVEELILQKRYEEANQLKKINELKRQGKDYSAGKVDRMLEAEADLREVKYKQGLSDKYQSLHDRARQTYGQSRQVEEDAAIRDAKKSLGVDKLSPEQEAKIKEYAQLSWGLSNLEKPNNGDLSIKTNSLTARGGFSSGAAAPDATKYAQSSAEYTRSIKDIVERIASNQINAGKI